MKPSEFSLCQILSCGYFVIFGFWVVLTRMVVLAQAAVQKWGAIF
jgi:hypothetical protein